MFEHFDFSVFLHPLIAFTLVVLLAMPFRKVAQIFGIVDAPGGRKQHIKAVPPIGGLIIFSVFMAYGVISGVVNLPTYRPLYVALIILLVTGAIDDRIALPAAFKFLMQIVAACVIAFQGNVQAAYLGDLFGFGVVWTGFMSYPFTITAIVLLINALNLIDGMDGLAGGLSISVFFWFLIACVVSGWHAQAHVLGLLMACILGFLVYNKRNPWRRKASLFLGDAGSMSLGLTIAWFAVLLARNPEAPLEPISVAWILGFPIFDTCAQFYRRVRNGQSPFKPDRGHFHHHFIDAGVPVRTASLIIIGLITFMGGIGYLGILIGLPPAVLTVAWIILLFTHMAISSKPDSYVAFIKKFSGCLGEKPLQSGDANNIADRG